MPALPAPRNLLTLTQEVFADHPPFHLAAAERRRIVAAFEPGNDALFAAVGVENPYRVETLDFPDAPAGPGPNIRLRDLMMLLGEVLDFAA